MAVKSLKTLALGALSKLFSYLRTAQKRFLWNFFENNFLLLTIGAGLVN
jgi:hypothetical protein